MQPLPRGTLPEGKDSVPASRKRSLIGRIWPPHREPKPWEGEDSETWLCPTGASNLEEGKIPPPSRTPILSEEHEIWGFGRPQVSLPSMPSLSLEV